MTHHEPPVPAERDTNGLHCFACGGEFPATCDCVQPSVSWLNLRAALSTPPARPGRGEIARWIRRAMQDEFLSGNTWAQRVEERTRCANDAASQILALFDGASA